jgi:exopolysaccharide biosynthesis operon protein EpsL
MSTSEHSGGRGGGAAFGPPALVLLILAAGAASWAREARALWDDKLEAFVAHSVTRDDNVFRISGDSDPVSVLGAPSKADKVKTTSVGLNLDMPLSRQRILGGLSFSTNRYDRFTVLDFTERHARAGWQWQVGSDLSGRLAYTNDHALASLANVQGGVQSGTPNPLETQKTVLDATYRVTPRWHLRGEVSRIEQENELAERQANDIRNDGAVLALMYVTPAETRIGLELQRQDGELPNPQLVNGTLVDNSYRQDRFAVVFDWTLSGLSRLRASAGRVERSFVQLPLRDHSTGIFHADYEWRPTDKLTLVAAAQKDIAAPDEINAGVNIGFVLVKSIALRPVYRMTEEVSVSGLLDYSDREYLGDPGLALGTVAPRSDRVRTAALAVSYQPIRVLRLELVLRRETRTSTAAFGDYESDFVSLGARLAF